MATTIAVSFDSYEAAQHAARELQQHGYEPGHINVIAGNDATQFGSEGQLPIEPHAPSEGGVGALQVLIDRLTADGVTDAQSHADAIRSGGAVVTVKLDDDRAEDAAQIMRSSSSGSAAPPETPRKEAPISHDSGASWRDQISHFRAVHRIEFGGADFDEFEPAYHYGWDVGSDERLRDQSWSGFESAMQVDWERRYPDGEWGRVARAVRLGFDYARAEVAAEDSNR